MRRPLAGKRTVQPDSNWNRYVGTYTDPFGWEAEVMVFNNKLVIYDYSYPPKKTHGVS